MSTLVWSSWSALKNVLSKLIFLLGLATALYFFWGGAIPGGSPLIRSPQDSSGSVEPHEAPKSDGSLIASPLQTERYALTAPSPVSAPEAAATPVEGAVAQAPAEAAALEGEAPPGQPGEFVPAAPYFFDPGSGSSGPERAQGNDSSPAVNPLPGGMASGIGGGMGAFGAFGNNAYAGTPAYGSSGGFDAGSTLTSQDLALLATPLKTMFSAPNLNVAGVFYPAGDSSTSTSQVTASPVSTTRWNLTEGVRQDGTFTISGPDQNNLSLVLGLNFQNQGSSSWQNFSAGTGVISTQVRSELRSGHPFRVFEFKLASFSIKPGDVLRQVHVLVALDVTSPGSPQVSNESRISFVRTGLKASNVAWPSPVNPASDPYVKADEVAYSIELQNAP